MNTSRQEKKIRLDKDFITRFVLWASQWTPIEKGAQTSLIFLVTLVSPPWKIYVSFPPKHNSCFDTSPLVKPHQNNNDNFSQIVVAQPIHNSFNLKQNRNFDPQLNNVRMNANSRTVVNNSCDFITWHYYELGSLNTVDNGFLDLHMHEFSKGSTIIIILMHGWIVWDIHTSKKS
jgi:hypothetical protein